MQMALSIRRRASRNFWIAGSLVLVLLIAMTSMRGWTEGPQLVHLSTAGDDESAAGDTSADPAPHRFQVVIRRPSGPPVIELAQADPLGRVGRVACSTCHSVREPDLNNRTPLDLTEFHQDMPLAHGKLACYSCHNPDDSETLRLADGSAVEYPNVMDLCAQCHGIQARGYARGSHGGMSGYWDLNRGGRVRNNCIDCHDPHVPEFPMMQPTFKPRDRFLTPPHEEADDREAERE